MGGDPLEGGGGARKGHTKGKISTNDNLPPNDHLGPEFEQGGGWGGQFMKGVVTE